MSETTFTYANAYNLSKALTDILSKNSGSTKFKLYSGMNLKLLEPIRTSVDELLKPSPEIEGLQKLGEAKRIELLDIASDKDENGKPKIENNNYVISEENLEKFKKDFIEFSNQIKDKNKDIVDAHEKKQKELEELLTESFDVSVLKKLKVEDLPEGISTQESQILLYIVN